MKLSLLVLSQSVALQIFWLSEKLMTEEVVEVREGESVSGQMLTFQV